MLNPAERSALHRALEIAAHPAVAYGPNPRVGCVLLDREGTVLAEGYHRGAGTPHAEADALNHARNRALAGTAPRLHGATAVVTLEPCTHTGRTGPCAQALIDAGVGRVVVARRDPNPVAAGGVQLLREAGLEVDLDIPADLAAAAGALNRGWEHGLHHARPLVTMKLALTLDGRAAAADGTSRWITGEAARQEVHDLRTTCDSVLIGTGTARADSPSLTARSSDGSLRPRQPVRAVMGTGVFPPLPTPDGAGEAIALRTRDPSAALEDLFARGLRHVLLEGGPSLAAAFLHDGLVDELIVHLAPTLLGAGRSATGDLGISTLADRLDLDLVDSTPLTSSDGRTDLRLTLRPRAA
ncbi:bifunctional diaminohydroxyphosphoribosylaminopyrimidine deaminase/5-amino-6-(5-phosphoribosylamino)uracil reductase RibD [Brachybacterium sp. 107]|uniref:bifunctional diaminohydroxyphosphoribosylaminopyrimidine deaminase/5-amino-6-(5-phosphoribosylamino)uracil reductase RibD n=1 Tax=Brachybacterium sp. 107 TaxID=3457736 RepID=UPI004034117B